jgi:hypothetical protein
VVARDYFCDIHFRRFPRRNNGMKKLLAVPAIGALIAAAAFTISTSSVAASTPGNDFQNDLTAAQAGPTGTANDEDTAAELEVDNGQVENVDVQSGDTGDHQDGAVDAGQSGGSGDTNS